MTLSSSTGRRSLPLLLLAAVLLCLAAPRPASASDCPGQSLERPFLPWGDAAQYVLVPGGSFGEQGASGWQLSGARLVSDNAPWNVSGDPLAGALALDPATSAVSAPLCVSLLHPTMRFFAAGPAAGRLDVHVLYELDGRRRSLHIGTLRGGDRWSPTLPLPLVVNLLSLLHGSFDVSFRFSAVEGSWLVDDVYVDPYRKG